MEDLRFLFEEGELENTKRLLPPREKITDILKIIFDSGIINNNDYQLIETFLVFGLDHYEHQLYKINPEYDETDIE